MDKKQNTIKWLVIIVVSLLFFAFFVGLVINGKNRNKPKTESGKTEISEIGRERVGVSKGDTGTASAGITDRKVTLVEFADLQCPACKAYHPVVLELLNSYPNNVKLLFKHFPLVAAHRNAMPSAIAAEAAGEQNKFFEYVDLLYNKQEQWSSLPNPEDKFIEYAKNLNLNIDKFRKDLKKSELSARIEEQRNEGIKNGVTGTPSFFLNGVKIENPADLAAFKKVVDEALKKPEAPQAKEASPTPQKGLPLQ